MEKNELDENKWYWMIRDKLKTVVYYGKKYSYIERKNKYGIFFNDIEDEGFSFLEESFIPEDAKFIMIKEPEV